ncbi:MAG: hypothetical protein RPS47_07265 [Colwellia sp.]
MKEITGLLSSVKGSVSSEVDEKYKSISKIKLKRKYFYFFTLPIRPAFFIVRVLEKFFYKVVKMKKIGFPFRYLRILFKIVSYVKRIEELEKNNYRLEKELSELKKQWFSGKV